MKWLFSRAAHREASIHALYGTIVAQARLPSFYRQYGIADTVNGRFDMIVLHAALFLNRVSSEPEAVRQLGQGVFDLFCRDMDANLREMGISDIGVPKEMQRMGEAFYGRAAAYRAALEDHDQAALGQALTRNVFEGHSASGVVPLAAYVRNAVARLEAQDTDALAAGRLDWPNPDLIFAEAER